MDKLKNRRGVTLVLMAFMLTVLIGSAAFAVDFGRMFLFRTQLHTAADAAALAGVFQVLQKAPSSATDSAISFAAKHKVDTMAVSLSASDVIPGTWTAAGGFVTSTWTDPNLDAVQVTTRYTGAYGFGKVLGLSSHNVTATSQAVMGYVGMTTCVRPVALPYQALLDQLTKDDGVVRDAATYVLTQPDVTALRNAGVADAVQLRVTDEGTSPVNGNFYGVQLGPYEYADGTLGNPNTGMANFNTDLGGPCSGESYQGTVGPGDWLAPENGEGGNNIPSGIAQLCGLSPSDVNGNKTVACPTPYPEIKAALWAPNPSPPSGCSNCFYIKVVGVFAVTGYVSTPGHTAGDGVIGYFTAMPSSGSLTTTPGPILKIGLVK
jgi:Flp pilus assembly protein TadG